MHMTQITRRHFLKAGTVAAGASLLSGGSVWAQPTGSNSDVRMAVIGFNGQGKSHIDGLRRVNGVRIVALCDVDKAVLEREAKKFRDRNEAVTEYTDVRKLLADPNVDAVSIATPNHWHALIAIWAIQAGKDVYVEKPVCHNVSEGRRIVEAARKHKRIVQTGTQSRSNPGMREAMAYLHAGQLGRIKLARGLCYKRRASIGKVSGPQTPPASVDYDLWCGPAPLDPLMRTRLHYDWHWVWQTGNGDLGNQGIHQMDIARWALQETTLSPQVLSVGGRLGYVDDGTTPNTQFIIHDYAKAPLIFEVRGLTRMAGVENMDVYKGASIGVIVECENGSMSIPTYFSATATDLTGRVVKEFRSEGSHFENFIKAVRSRKMEDLNADILEGHLSSGLCHTGNISYRLGEHASPEKIKEQLASNPAAAETFERCLSHLTANQVDLSKQPLTLGAFLKMDVKKEHFTNNKDANTFLRREYRKGFVVPDKV